MLILVIPFILQGIIMFVDEFYFHYKRGLPLWERVGHPLDTLTTFLPFALIGWNSYSLQNLYVYIGLAVFSCLFITKDEFVHAEECAPLEQWLHSLLFVLHPVTFVIGWYIWRVEGGGMFLRVQSVIVLMFMFYQILRWGPLWQARKK